MLFTFAVCAADGGAGGNRGEGVNGADGGDGTSDRSGCPGGTNPDASGKFYLPGTQEPCNPGKQDARKSASHLKS